VKVPGVGKKLRLDLDKKMGRIKAGGVWRLSREKAFAVLAVVILLLAGVFVLLKKGHLEVSVAEVSLPEDFYIVIDEPSSKEEMLLAACVSMLSVGEVYRPLFVLENGDLNWHELATIQNMSISGWTPVYFTFDTENTSLPPRLSSLGDVVVIPLTRETVLGLTGFAGEITVASYEEALWAAPYAYLKGYKLVPGPSSFSSQEEVWELLYREGVSPDYVVVANPEDYRTDIFYTVEMRYKDGDGNALAQPEEYNASFHIPSLSLMAVQLACAHNGWVLTDAPPSTEDIGYMNTTLNARAIGIYLKLREIYEMWGPIEYIALVGSAEAVPQFELPDETDTDPESTEGDGLVSSDVVYGFLTDDIYTMVSAVGRIVNYNLAGASMMVARTLGYDYYVKTVAAEYTTGTKEVEWRKHASVWNGFEVADQRRQMDPGRFAVQDLHDEGYTVDYMQTSGTSAPLSDNHAQEDWRPVIESSALVTYRGHGSWHATFYVYKPEEPTDPRSKSRLEGRDLERYEKYENSPSVVLYNLPPQVGILVSCENAKIHGCHWWGEPVDMEKLWATNYLYSGAVGLVAATEVSFSNLGQDIKDTGVLITGNGHWDLNNCWYAFVLDGLINHEDEHGTIGKAVQWAENRYIHNPNKDSLVSPLEPAQGRADWKEVAMFACYGDPAFGPIFSNPGSNSFDPWHNGPEDQ